MSARFEVLEHTADIGIIAHGSDLKEAFANAGAGLFSLMVDLGSVMETVEREIKVEAPELESLLVDWLNELIYLFDAEHLLFSRFEIMELDGGRLRARAFGEPVDPKRHEIRMGVKATTYHQLRIEKDHGYKFQVIFDI
ncbi:MAG: archease [Chloroflexi bacterium]|nr:archease [Chloroflexota bacterium]